MQACTAGARFLVSPGMTPELAAAALATERPYLPGVATPSEVMTARGLGISFLKLFPAEAVGGLALLQALAPVFPRGRLLPHRRHRRVFRTQLPGAAQCADGRRVMDGAQGGGGCR